MDKERRQQIVEKYSRFFRDENPVDGVILPLKGRFECDDGWLDLIESFFAEADRLNDTIRITQIKEKFGHLNIYYTGGSNELFTFSNKLSHESTKVCEMCGTRKFVGRTSKGWIKHICYSCFEEKKKSPRPLQAWMPNNKREFTLYMREQKLKRILNGNNSEN